MLSTQALHFQEKEADDFPFLLKSKDRILHSSSNKKQKFIKITIILDSFPFPPQHGQQNYQQLASLNICGSLKSFLTFVFTEKQEIELIKGARFSVIHIEINN